MYSELNGNLSRCVIIVRKKRFILESLYHFQRYQLPPIISSPPAAHMVWMILIFSMTKWRIHETSSNTETISFAVYIVSDPIGNLNNIYKQFQLCFWASQIAWSIWISYRTRILPGELPLWIHNNDKEADDVYFPNSFVGGINRKWTNRPRLHGLEDFSSYRHFQWRFIPPPGNCSPSITDLVQRYPVFLPIEQQVLPNLPAFKPPTCSSQVETKILIPPPRTTRWR
jgi:hypothetical protein